MKVVVASPGVGIVNRGYEVFATQLAQQLAAAHVQVELLAGGHDPPDAGSVRRVRTVRRDGAPARWLGRLAHKEPHSVEQYVFAASAAPSLRRLRPDVIVASESVLFAIWDRFRPALRLEGTAFLLTNGGSRRPPFRHVDAVIHHAEDLYEIAARAEPDGQHHRLPCPVHALSWEMVLETRARRTKTLEALGVPPERHVCVAIGSIDRDVKRSDYIVKEVAAIARRRNLHLVLLGRVQHDQRALSRQFEEALGDRLTMVEVGPGRVPEVIAAADVHLSASLAEGFGRVLLEAQAVGTESIVHDSERSRRVMRDVGIFVDARRPGAMAAALDRFAVGHDDLPARRRRWEVARASSWDIWADRYVQVIEALGRSR